MGIDDFAFRKRFSYGTIFINLETGHPIDMIPSTKTADVTQWLSAHPEIHLITRDGSRGYAKAVREASSAILQVADCWHVLHQLFEASKKAVYDCLPFEWIPPDSDIAADYEVPSDSFQEPVVVKEWIDPRWERIQQSQALFAEGYPIATIARMLGVVRNTIYADLRVTRPPTRQRESPYKRFTPLIKSLVTKGWTTHAIEEECRAQGYNGSLSTLNGMVARSRGHLEKEKPPAFRLRQQVLRLIWNPPNDDSLEEMAGLHPKLLESFPLLVKLQECVHSFRQLLKEQEDQRLFAWMKQYEELGNPFIRSFIKGIRKDVDAILLGIRMPWSNGPVEGAINRLKMIKRLVYGRAGVHVLRNRLLYRF